MSITIKKAEDLNPKLMSISKLQFDIREQENRFLKNRFIGQKTTMATDDILDDELIE